MTSSSMQTFTWNFWLVYDSMSIENEAFPQLYLKKLKLSRMHIQLYILYKYDVLSDSNLPLTDVKRILLPQKSISLR